MLQAKNTVLCPDIHLELSLEVLYFVSHVLNDGTIDIFHWINHFQTI
jgi:hypothetical protein